MSSSPLTLSTLIPHLSPESELLLACIQPKQNEKTKQRIDTLAAGPIDGYYLMQIAEKHRVMPSLYRNFPTDKSSSIPTQVRQELRGRFFKNAQRNLRLTQQLLELVEAFASQDIPAIPYKGMVLAASAYGKISLRQVWDVDILVREQDVAKSRDYLLSNGFKAVESFDREQSFFSEERDVELDLHWGLTPFYFPIGLTFEQLWQHRQNITINNTAVVKSFSDENLLLVLCVQIAKDCWERRQHIENLAKVCDIAALLHTSKQIDWDSCLMKGRQAGIYRIVLFGLGLAHSLFNATIPKRLEAEIYQTPTVVELIQQVCKSLFGTFDDDFSDPRSDYSDIAARRQQLSFYLKLRERPVDRGRHVLQILKTLPVLLSSSVSQ